MRKHGCNLLRLVAFAEATHDWAISGDGEEANRAFLHSSAGLRALTQHRMRNLETRELRIVGAFKLRGPKLKVVNKVMSESVKSICLFIRAESTKRFCSQFVKLRTSRPECNLKG